MANTMMKGKQDRVGEAEQVGHDWSELPGELLALIGQRLIKLKLAIRFRAVCTRWRRTLAELQPMMFRQSSPSPLLMLPYCNDDQQQQLEGCQCRLFLDLVHNQYHHIDFVEGLERSSCRGSAFGWLFMLQLPVPLLLNPLTGKQIQLPPITSFSDVLEYDPEKLGLEYLVQDPLPEGGKIRLGKRRLGYNYMRRFAMSSADPTSEDCTVMVIRQNNYMNLAFCKPGEEEWVLIPNPDGNHLQNIVFWRNQFYAIDLDSIVLRCDLSNPAVPTMSVFVDDVDMQADTAYLLVGPADELMMIAKCVEFDRQDVDDHGLPVHHEHVEEAEGQDVVDDHDEEAEDQDVDAHGLPVPPQHDEEEEVDDQASVFCVSDVDTDTELESRGTANYRSTFKVYKLNEDTRQWGAVQSIGDFALLVGTNTPTYLSTKNYPGVQSNCIYFTDDEFTAHVRRRFGGHDMGVYHLSDGTRESFCSTDLYKPGLIWPPPVWIVPSNC
ncbi:unnamed protein product [Linum tenue]|uniref:KIB1-4 beta-propeller domain-containing protein n=1 Tax=Linum tenue TaxID=586396 RepID=A0AAV0MZX4_9ROSI|nr:unnamed protein product [Linum tenue]